MIVVNEMPVRFGNKKLGKDTCIFNMTTACHCPSYKKGFCKIRGLCYALHAELIFPDPLEFRLQQHRVWKSETAMSIASSLLRQINRRKIETKFIRFSEAGDFDTQADVDKMSRIAELMSQHRFYGYSNRPDLDFSNMPDNVSVNGHGFMADNQINVVPKATGEHYVCPGDCRKCNACKCSGNKIIEIEEHGTEWSMEAINRHMVKLGYLDLVETA